MFLVILKMSNPTPVGVLVPVLALFQSSSPIFVFNLVSSNSSLLFPSFTPIKTFESSSTLTLFVLVQVQDSRLCSTLQN